MSKVIVVTGVTQGLGRTMAAGFIEAGHTVAGCGRSQSRIDELSQQYGDAHLFTAVDITNQSAVQTWSENVLDQLGTPDLLINNAALINENAPLWEVPVEEFDTVIDVNIKGTANTIRNFLPAMIERESGVVVNFSSGWGRSTSAEVATYCATKWAIEGLTMALAQELPRGMAAIPLNPGIINTEMLQSCFGSQAQHYPTAQEWAEISVPFLLGLSAKHNGQQLSVPL
ncbi:MAG: SDR family oxidoreductase [Planctomycetes bacterium]|nr:SDR family oxidoreductase [Planctomycetota bacterium]MCH9723950.1 SDR family oxidoreductase [Planctomycetota bacterium]MCH9778676.1 SDR family oxidoreductase [Planctomycetota bacterium]MCH9790484.1 SDR family oxidoreductase [Planctomycetota bacterium]